MKKIYVRERKNGCIEYTTSGKERFSYTTNGHGKYAKLLAQMSLKTGKKINNYYEYCGEYYKIFIYNKTFGYFYFTISVNDFNKVQKYKWNVIKDYKTFYVTNKKAGLLHRYIMDTPDDLVVDHIDGNGLNNTRENLRNVMRYINMRNIHKDNNIGIYRSSKSNSYYAVIAVGDKTISKSFNITKYGEHVAKKLAIDWRRKHEKEFGYYGHRTKLFHKIK